MPRTQPIENSQMQQNYFCVQVLHFRFVTPEFLSSFSLFLSNRLLTIANCGFDFHFRAKPLGNPTSSRSKLSYKLSFLIWDVIYKNMQEKSCS